MIIGYVRRSDERQGEETTERQAALIRQHCELMDWQEPLFISDVGSGFSDKREGYQHLLRLCSEGSVERVVVYNLSRLSRSVRDTLDFVDRYVRDGDVQLVSLRESIDTSTPMGMAFIGVMAIFNQLYRDEISHNTKRAIAHKRSRGEHTGGTVPYGYRQVPGTPKVEEDPGEQANVAIMRRMAASGQSATAIAAWLTKAGVPTKTGERLWQRKTVARILSRTGAGKVK